MRLLKILMFFISLQEERHYFLGYSVIKLTFLGTGSAFTLGEGNFQSNMLLESSRGRKMLVDCGMDARFSLHELGYSHKDIDDVYISHLHADHAGGLEWLAFSSYFNQHQKKISLYIHESLVTPLWNNVLSGGLSSLEGKIATLDSYFDVHAVPMNISFFWEGIEFQLIQTIHVMSGFTIIPCFGLYFSTGEHEVYVTTDTRFAPHQIMKFYKSASIIFQDCETAKIESGVHATFDQLVSLPEEIRKKMWLYHYNPGPLPDAKKKGFLGFVKKGQSFEF